MFAMFSCLSPCVCVILVLIFAHASRTMKSMSKTGFSFGRPSFRALRQGDDTPGPGEYQTVTTMREAHGPQYSIRGHNTAMKMKKASNMPGPANYYPQLPRARPSFSIGSGLRFRRDGAQNANTPGPSDYDISRSVIAHRTAPSIVIASKPNMKQYGASTPGPAEYSPDVKDSSRKGFSLLGRSREHSGRDQGPGPGAYNVVRDPTKARETPAYSIGARPKGPGSDIAKKYLPGPGSYQPRGNSRVRFHRPGDLVLSTHESCSSLSLSPSPKIWPTDSSSFSIDIVRVRSTL